jgi:mono/diheme cytochrome c family protein
MRLVSLSLLIVTTILLASACYTPGPITTNEASPPVAASPATKTSATPDEFAVARATFLKDCTVCHGADGQGGPVTVEGKKLRVPNLREGHALKEPDEDFVKQITKGGDGMPAFSDKLSPAEIDDLVRFIRKEFQNK